MFFREDEDAIFEEDTNEWVTKKQAEHIQQLRASNERLRQQLEVARRALEPFSNIYEELVEDEVIKPKESERGITIFTNVFDLRAAASSYEALTEAGKCKDGG